MKNKKVGAHTIKGAIIEIIVSLIVMAGIFALAVYDNHVSLSARFYSRIGFYFLAFGLGLVSFLDGVITIPSLLKQKKEKASQNTENTESE